MRMMTKTLLTIVLIALSIFNLPGSDGRMFGNTTSIKVKTIHGDEYNCVDIYKQPAFDHPALRNHKISMELIHELEEEKDENSIFHPRNIWLGGLPCPKGTVPIRQVTKLTAQPAPPFAIQIMREATKKKAGLLDCDLRLNSTANTNSLPVNGDFAGIEAKTRPENSYHGASAIINIYNPALKGDDQISTALISIQQVKTDGGGIQAGWTVDPSLYGDTQTRLFTRWIGGGKSCANDRCPGYVIVNRNIPVDYVFPDISHREKAQFDRYFGIFMHPDSRNWHFSFNDEKNVMGYWPKEIFGVPFDNGADVVYFGGLALSPNNVSPEMGSGEFNNEIYKITCYMRQVKVMDKSFTLINPDNSFIAGHDSRCYYEGGHSLNSDPYWSYRFGFGGTGGKDCRDCLY